MSEMKHDSEFQGRIEAELEEHRAERANAAKKAADELAAKKGWPLEMADGSEVLAVAKHYRGQRMFLVDEEGNEYQLNGADKFELVGDSNEMGPSPAIPAADEDSEGGDDE